MWSAPSGRDGEGAREQSRGKNERGLDAHEVRGSEAKAERGGEQSTMSLEELVQPFREEIATIGA